MKPARPLAACLLLASTTVICSAQPKPARPHITGISHISVYDTSAAQAGHFYVDVIGCTKARGRTKVSSAMRSCICSANCVGTV